MSVLSHFFDIFIDFMSLLSVSQYQLQLLLESVVRVIRLMFESLHRLVLNVKTL